MTSPGRVKGQRSRRKKRQFPCVNYGFPCCICSNMAERENIAEKGETKGPEVVEREEKYGPWQCIKCDFQGDKDSVIHHHLDMHYPHRDIPFTCVKCEYKINVRGKAWNHQYYTHGVRCGDVEDLCYGTMKEISPFKLIQNCLVTWQKNEGARLTYDSGYQDDWLERGANQYNRGTCWYNRNRYGRDDQYVPQARDRSQEDALQVRNQEDATPRDPDRRVVEASSDRNREGEASGSGWKPLEKGKCDEHEKSKNEKKMEQANGPPRKVPKDSSKKQGKSPDDGRNSSKKSDKSPNDGQKASKKGEQKRSESTVKEKSRQSPGESGTLKRKADGTSKGSAKSPKKELRGKGVKKQKDVSKVNEGDVMAKPKKSSPSKKMDDKPQQR